jgi:hypothetical protein
MADMVRKLLAVSLLVAGLAVLAGGVQAELTARDVREPILETGVIFGAAFIVSAVLACGAYVLWPKSN